MMNRDLEILKIQVLADYYHNRSNLLLSFILTAFVTFTIALMTLVYEGHISLPVYYLSLGIVLICVFYGLYTLEKRYSKCLDRIDSLLKQVEKGELLPSLKELRK
jgi:FtsH-binding integral membrane protein